MMIGRSSSRRRFLAGFAPVLLLLVWGAATAQMDAARASSCSLYPAVVATHDGRLMVTYRDFRPVSGRPRVRVAVWNGEWTFLEPLFPDGEPRSSSNPSLTLDDRGRPLVAWERCDGRDQRLEVQRWDGDGWQGVGTEVRFGEAQNTFEPSLAWRASELVLAWREYDEAGQNNDIYVARWDERAWTPLGGALDVDPMQGSYSPVLALDSAGVPVVAWREHGAGVGTNIRVERWDGSGWRDLGGVVSNDPTRAAEVPSLAIDRDDRPVIAWQEHDGTSTNVYVARWDGRAWRRLGGALDVAPERAAHRPSLAIDPAGKPVVAWSERHEVETVFVKRWDGTRWRSVAGAAGGADTSAEGAAYAPSLAIAPDGSITIAWHEFDGTTYRLRFRHWDGEAWRDLPAPAPGALETEPSDALPTECTHPSPSGRLRAPAAIPVAPPGDSSYSSSLPYS